VLTLVRLQAVCERGKQALGEGYNQLTYLVSARKR